MLGDSEPPRPSVPLGSSAPETPDLSELKVKSSDLTVCSEEVTQWCGGEEGSEASPIRSGGSLILAGGEGEGEAEEPQRPTRDELNARIAGLRVRIEQHFEDLEKR